MDKYAYHAKSKQYSQDTWYHVSWNYIIKALSEKKGHALMLKVTVLLDAYLCAKSHTTKLMERNEKENTEDERRNRKIIQNGRF